MFSDLSLPLYSSFRSGAEAAGLEVESREFVPGVPFSDKKDKDGSKPPDALGYKPPQIVAVLCLCRAEVGDYERGHMQTVTCMCVYGQGRRRGVGARARGCPHATEPSRAGVRLVLL